MFDVEAAEPATPEPVGSADRRAVFDLDGIRNEGGRKSAECGKESKRAAITGAFAIPKLAME
jgi:hypothetical protein